MSELSILGRILGWALLLILALLALMFGTGDEAQCVHCQRPARQRDNLGRPVCYLHGQVRR
jgi:cytochrome c oxidase assembly factor CtaG